MTLYNNNVHVGDMLLCAVSIGGTSGVTLEKMLKFITGQSSIPPRGLKNSIKIDYNRDESFPYPTAECCFSIITLPVAYNTYPGFANAMDNGILWAGDQFLWE
jgi:hypothetical protein